MSAKLLNKNQISRLVTTLFIKNIKIKHVYMPHKRCLKTSVYKSSSNIILDKMNDMNAPFKFTNFDCIGFDLDNTICKYKVGPMLKMEYEVIAEYLVNVKKYPSMYLYRPIEENVDFLIKGLIVDFQNGNLLKIGSNGKILHASHGTKHLTQEEIEKTYDKNLHWSVTDVFTGNPLATWNGPLSEKMRSLLDYFDMPTGLIFARLVDTVDEMNDGKPLKEYNLSPDIIAALTNMYDITQFELNKGGYFPNMKANPNDYIEKCSDNIINWLKSLKKQNKILFLITGSYIDFASLTSKTCMGEKWHDFFDIVIFYAKKPGFFTDNRPFICAKTQQIICGSKLEKGGWYVQGNWKYLYQFLSTLSNKKSPRVAYVGDNLIQDIYTPALHANCETVAIVEELEAEGVFGFPVDHDHQDYLVSKRWGSFFGDYTNEENSTFWLNIIKKHSKLCVPSIEYIASKPIDFDFKIN